MNSTSPSKNEQNANTNITQNTTNEQSITTNNPQENKSDTPAVRFLKNNNVEFAVHQYEYLEKGGKS